MEAIKIVLDYEVIVVKCGDSDADVAADFDLDASVWRRRSELRGLVAEVWVAGVRVDKNLTSLARVSIIFVVVVADKDVAPEVGNILGRTLVFFNDSGGAEAGTSR